MVAAMVVRLAALLEILVVGMMVEMMV